VNALNSNSPAGWPAYQENPQAVWRYIARSIGHGLNHENARGQEVKSLYSRIVVKAEFGTTRGVTINAKDFIGWIIEASEEKQVHALPSLFS